MKTPNLHGDAYAAVRHVYDKSPGRSWRRLNSALQQTLTAAITGHLSFLPDDFRAIYRDMNGGYWMGNSIGSHVGEGYYNIAVGAGHTPACISFENFAGRPAALWAGYVKTAARLRIGSEFTWNGTIVTVTNIMKDHLVACTYERAEYRHEQNAVSIGSYECLNDRKYRQIEQVISLDNEAIHVKFGPPVDDPCARKPKMVTKIAFTELAAVRAKFERLRRDALKQIATADTSEALTAVAEALSSASSGTYRHFDIEDFRKAITERERGFGLNRVESADIDAWMAGAPTYRYFTTVRLRVRNGRVETSTGQSASVESVRKVLPIVLRRRGSRGPVVNLSVDSYRVQEQTKDGVLVGCTLIPWSEVERLPSLLGA